MNIRLESVLDQIANNYYFTRSNIYNTSLPYTDRTAFLRFMKFSIQSVSSGGEFEFPVIAKNQLELDWLGLKYTRKEKGVDAVLYLLCNVETTYVKSGRTAVSQLLEPYSPGIILKKVIYKSSNVVYYGGRGVIFDRDWNLLFLATIEGHISSADDKLHYKGLNVYIHPKVFQSKGVVEKSIVRDVLPILTHDRTPVILTRPNISVREGRVRISDPNIKIMIGDVYKRFIDSPKEPEATDLSNDVVKILLSKVNEGTRCNDNW